MTVTCMIFLFMILLLLGVRDINAQFDYQVGARAQDAISSFLTYVRKAAALPYIAAQMRGVNITDPYDGGPRILFPSAKANKEYLPTWYYGLETGYAFLYYTGVPSVAFAKTNSAEKKSPTWEEHYYHPVTGDLLGPTGLTRAYDVRTRPWYAECKAANKTIWAKPFFSFGTQNPALAYAQPFYNLRINGRIYRGLSGVTSFETNLNGINDYLYSVYSNSKYDIFIMEKNTLNLIGSSWGAKSYIILSSTTRQFIKATESDDSLIKSATLKLIEKDFSKALFVMGDKYVQCDSYFDPAPGLEWYVVVLMPATVASDHLGRSSSLYDGVLVLASFAMGGSFLGLTITFYFLNTKLLRWTRPLFTITVLTGAFMVSLYCYLLLGENTIISCAFRPWIFNLAFTFAFAPLLIKAWRVHIMFNVNPLSKNKLVSSLLLFSYTLGMVVIDASILAVTLYGVGDGTKPRTDLVLSSYGAYTEMTFCSYTFNNAFFYSEVIYKGLLILIACIISFLIRKIAGIVAGSKSLVIIVYNIGFVSLVVLSIGRSLSDVETRIFLQVVGISYCVLVTAFVLVWPTFHSLITVGDDAAADDVLNEVLESSRAQQSFSRKASASQSQNLLRGQSFMANIAALSKSPSVFNMLAERRNSKPIATYLERNPSLPRDKPLGATPSAKVQVVRIAPIAENRDFRGVEAQPDSEEKGMI